MNELLNTVRLAVVYPKVHVGNVAANIAEITAQAKALYVEQQYDVLLLPELAITGYTCADLFNQTALLEAAALGVQTLAMDLPKGTIAVVGLPLEVNNSLYNCAAVLHNGAVIGIIPKTFLPNYKEFYEKRWFKAASASDPTEAVLKDAAGYYNEVPFGTDLLFASKYYPGFKIGVEICEDIWAPIPPSSFQAIAGATLLLNLSASNETVAKSEYRRQMIEQQSGRCVAAYAYCSSGPTESTTDLLFGGHCIVAENGSILKETSRFKDSDSLVIDIDIEKLVNERRRTPTFNDSQQFLTKTYRTIQFYLSHKDERPIQRTINSHPFVPADPATLKVRCEEIFNIQVAALSKRLSRIGSSAKVTIGISGGLDSTLAALVIHRAYKKLGWDLKNVDAITMPGFGTSNRTRTNSTDFIRQLGFKFSEVDIRPLCIQAFKDIGHKPFGLDAASQEFVENLKTLPPNSKDVVFENVQARIRTFILMSRGFVIGTGDMSELALGWCTYNGDHMSMYNPNCSIPKTLVKFLVKYVTDNEIHDGPLFVTLTSILETTISPELLPLGQDGEIAQSTEEVIGPYELHDFFLFNFVRNNFAPPKIATLAKHAFGDKYDSSTIVKWLKVFLTKFFFNQFKRSCVPDGPKVGSVSLSPRGDWRMPSDAEVALWLSQLKE